MNGEKAEQKDSGISGFVGIGSVIGVIIGGANFGIIGAMIGGVLGTIVVSSGIELQIKDLRTKGKFHPFKGAIVLSYVLAVVLTFIAIKLAPVVNDFLTHGGEKPSRLTSILVLFVGPAFAGGVGALIPLWMSPGGNRTERVPTELLRSVDLMTPSVHSQALKAEELRISPIWKRHTNWRQADRHPQRRKRIIDVSYGLLLDEIAGSHKQNMKY